MSYKLAKAALHLEGLPTTQKIVLIALADYANDETGECWPAQETIAGLCGMSRKTVNQSVKALTDKGIVKQNGWHGKTPNYRLNLLPTVTPVTESYTNLLPTVTPPVTQGYTKVLPTVTQIDNINNREENKESNKQASNSIVSNNIEIPTPQMETPKMQTTPQAPTSSQAPTPQATPAAAAACGFDLIDIGLAALARLKAEGIDDKEAKEKLHAVADAFKCEAKDLKKNGFRGISNPKAYLTAKLYGMAKEGPKQATPQADEPTLLEEIFELLKKEWATQYPEVADRIKSFEINDLHPSTENKLRAKEYAAWKSVKGSRVAYVRSTLDGTIFERVQAWRQDELKETGNFMQTLKGQLAQLRSFPNAYYHPTIPLEEHLKDLETKLARAKEKYHRLRMATTRHNAA